MRRVVSSPLARRDDFVGYDARARIKAASRKRFFWKFLYDFTSKTVSSIPQATTFSELGENSKKDNSALILAGALSLAGVGGCRYLSACSCSRVRVPSPSSRRSAKRVELRRPFRSFWVLGFGFWEKLVKAQKGFASRSPASVADLADGGGDALRCGEGNGDGEGRGCLLGG